MNSYIDYTYYTETFGGTLVPQNDFDKLSKLASQEVKIRILGRDITDYETEVKDCTCYVLDNDFEKLLRKFRYLFHEYFLEAIKGVAKPRPIPRPVKIKGGK